METIFVLFAIDTLWSSQEDKLSKHTNEDLNEDANEDFTVELH